MGFDDKAINSSPQNQVISMLRNEYICDYRDGYGILAASAVADTVVLLKPDGLQYGVYSGEILAWQDILMLQLFGPVMFVYTLNWLCHTGWKCKNTANGIQ